MNDVDDPRVFFAAERTLLAWVRTALTVIGLGFLVARFGLFLKLVSGDPDATAHFGSTVIGVVLVLMGAVSVAVAAVQHVRFCRTLRSAARPKSYVASWSVWFAGSLSIIGIVLAGYILLRAV